jgi:serine/threonine protein kinase/Tol biopolymer transport system component
LIADRFEIERWVESGGMGAVYCARDRRTGNRVALKLMLPEGRDPTLPERFAREGRLLRELSHPGIVAYVDHGQAADGRLYLAMEWLDGEDLRRRLKRGPLSVGAAVVLLRQVAGALAVAHGRGVVHRDLKPGNLFLVGGEVARVKVLDFGIARRLEASLAMTRTGVLMGTPLYMAPEQASRGSEIGPATDLFSLGCVVYECLTCEPPFAAGTYAAILKRVLLEDPAPVEARCPDVPEPLAALIRRMLEKHPTRRPPDGGALLAALDALGELPSELFAPRSAPFVVVPKGGAPSVWTARTKSARPGASTRVETEAPSEPFHDEVAAIPPGGPMFERGQILAGRYRILRFISSGGAGEVYVAEDEDLHVRVALKSIHESAARAPGALDRFKKEILLARMISHPNVCRIFDFGHHEGGGAAVSFLTMEMLDGESLAERIEQRGRIPVADARPLVRQIAAALGAAHDAGVVHRDLKPHNVVVVPSPSGGRAVVADFGLALAIESATAAGGQGDAARLTDEGRIAGTPAYVAPEQIDGGPVTPRTDIYALGIVMYEMVTGELPFKGETVTAMVAARLVEPPLPPSTIVADLDPMWEAAILRCLEREPDARFASVADVMAALDPPRSRRPPSMPPKRPRSRWLRGLGAGAAIVALSVAAVFAFRYEPPPPTGNPRRLTGAPGWEAEPAISPDGKLVAYVSDEKGSADLWVVDARGGAPRRLTDAGAGDHTPTWFPDGSAIAFASDRGGQDGIWTVPSEGGPATPLVAGARDPAISPDGTLIAFARLGPGGRYTLWVAPLAEVGRARALTSDAGVDGLWQNRHPAWSPDGSTIAYQDFSNVWIVPAAGGRSRRLTEGNTGDGWPSWSRDGRHLYFASMRDDTLALWRMLAGGGPAVRLTFGTGPESEPRVSRDGARLAYSTYVEERTLILADAAAGTRARLPGVGEFAIAPDGSEVVYTSRRQGRADLWSQALEGRAPRGDPRHLTDLTVARPTFSPDGRWIAVHRVVDGQRDIWILPAKGGPMERFTDDPATDIQPAWSPDGAFIAFLSDRSGREQVWMAPVAGGRAAGTARQITSDDTAKNLPTWSPRGDEIAYTAGTGDESELWIVPVAGGAPRRITWGAGVHCTRWDRVSGEIYASGKWGGRFMSMRRVSPSTGEATPLDPEVSFGNVANGLFDLSLDGSTFALWHEEARGDIWVLDAPRGSSY